MTKFTHTSKIMNRDIFCQFHTDLQIQEAEVMFTFNCVFVMLEKDHLGCKRIEIYKKQNCLLCSVSGQQMKLGQLSTSFCAILGCSAT